MDLFEEEQTQKDKKTKNMMVIVASLLVILIMLAVGLYLYIGSLQEAKLKVVSDGVAQNAGTDTFIFAEDGTMYVSIKDFAPMVNYKYYNGGYKQYTEDTSMCNVMSSFEVASFEVNSNEFFKVQLNSTEDNQYFTASKPISLINEKLYAPEDAIEKAFNVAISYTPTNNKISILTLNYLLPTYISKYTNSALAGSNVDFSIQKAALYNYIVTLNAETKLYGVSTIEADGKLKEIIGDKYSKIEFIETSQDFVVTTEDNKKGLITNDGITRIHPEYDELKQIDNELNLYLIRVGSNYGVINKSGRYIVYPEYTAIGVDKTLYPTNNIKNPYLLFDNCIPVQKDKKWGIIDRNGKMIRNLEYDVIGCSTTTQRNTSTNNMLLIDDYEGIVVGKDKLYGLVDSLGNELIPCALQDIYSITNAGKDTVYMTYANEQIDLVQYLIDNGIGRGNTTQKPSNNIDNSQSQNTMNTNGTNTQTQNAVTNTNGNVNDLQGDTTMVTNTTPGGNG